MSHGAVSPFPVKRLKYVVSLRRSRIDGSADDRPYIGLENIESWAGKRLTSPAPMSDESQNATVDGTSLNNTFEQGDVLFGKLRPYLAKAWVADFSGRSTTELLAMRPLHADARFLLYVCLWRDFIDAVDASTFGSKMPRADWEFIGNMAIPLPPRAQQEAIAGYLDRETAQIDALVAAKERLLEILAEKRRALITHAVTRGLDSHVTLRDSGVPWLGPIPEHWKIVALRFLSKMTSGGTPDTNNPAFWDGEIPWVSPKDMKRDEIADSEDHVSPQALEQTVLKIIPVDTVLVVVRGMILAHSFPVAVTVGAVTINQDMKALTCGPRLSPRFLFNYLRGSEKHLVSLVDSSAHGTRKLETDVLGQLEVCIPPPGEQRAIVAHIAAETAKLDALRTATERSIALLKERRGALIAAAVTGQLTLGL